MILLAIKIDPLLLWQCSLEMFGLLCTRPGLWCLYEIPVCDQNMELTQINLINPSNLKNLQQAILEMH